MPLPGNVPNFSTYLVDFDNLDPLFVFPPAQPHRRAWDKAVELERKLHAFDWATMVVHDPRQCTTFIADLAFAFVIGFEATLQVMKHENPTRSDPWLRSLAEYDMPCRGVRTMRNLEAHIRSGQIQAGSGRGVYTRFPTPATPQPATAWRFSPISTADYNSLASRGRKLASSELAAWNQHVESEYAVNIMRSTLMALVEIVRKA